MTMNNSARTSDWIGQVKGGVIYAYDLGSVAFGSNIKWLDLTQVPTRRERQAPVVRHLPHGGEDRCGGRAEERDATGVSILNRQHNPCARFSSMA